MADSPEEMWDKIQMAADRGWKISFSFQDGTDMKEAFITQIDVENRAFLLEKIGERHLKPRLVRFPEILSVTLHW